MNIGFVFTNYNNSLLTIQAIHSILKSAGSSDVEIVIVDNASTGSEREVLASGAAEFPDALVRIVWNDENVGYFAGLNCGLDALMRPYGFYDFVVIGNNDLIFDVVFFDTLGEVGVIALENPVISPDIVTLDGCHQNPHVVHRISWLREVVWDLYYSSFAAAKVIGAVVNRFGSLFRRRDTESHLIEGRIRYGYGACYILTRKFFDKYGKLWSPGFLMGEEFYLYRQLYEQGDAVYYFPRLRVLHYDHASVSLIPKSSLWGYTRQYHKIYRFFINPWRLPMDNGKTPADYDNFL